MSSHLRSVTHPTKMSVLRSPTERHQRTQQQQQAQPLPSSSLRRLVDFFYTFLYIHFFIYIFHHVITASKESIVSPTTAQFHRQDCHKRHGHQESRWFHQQWTRFDWKTIGCQIVSWTRSQSGIYFGQTTGPKVSSG